MDSKPRNLGRAYLIGELQRRGLSRRGAKRILNFIFAEMSRALARDEAVEFPYGWPLREAGRRRAPEAPPGRAGAGGAWRGPRRRSRGNIPAGMEGGIKFRRGPEGGGEFQ